MSGRKASRWTAPGAIRAITWPLVQPCPDHTLSYAAFTLPNEETPCPNPQTVCPNCGVLHRGTLSCDTCKQTVDQTMFVPPSSLSWALLSCDFACRACGFATPVGHLDLDGKVQCEHCGLEQFFDVRLWRQILALAHDVADVAGPNLEARASDPSFTNVYLPPLLLAPDVWLSRTMGESPCVQVRVAPGHPTCAQCRVLRAPYSPAPDQIVLVCPQCDDRVTYNLPRSTELYPALAAVVAEEHCTEHKPAGVAGEGAAVALTCPSCNAPLPAAQDSRVVKCTFCQTAAYIPWKAWRSLSGAQPTSRPFWVCFEGPSDWRKTAEAKALKWREALRESEARSQIPDDVYCSRCGTLEVAGGCPVCDGRRKFYTNPIAGIVIGSLGLVVGVILAVVFFVVPFVASLLGY